MIGGVTITADGSPRHSPLYKGAKSQADRRPVQPSPEDDDQLTPAHEQARAYMRSLVEDPDHDDEVQDRADTELDKTRRILPAPADSPGHDVGTSGLARQLRDHHSMRTVGGIAVEHVDLQQLGPKPLTDLHTAGPDGSGSSIYANPGQARVQSLEQAAASASITLPGSPSASPNRPDFGPAPSGHGQRSGKTPSRPAGRMAAMRPPESGS